MDIRKLISILYNEVESLAYQYYQLLGELGSDTDYI